MGLRKLIGVLNHKSRRLLFKFGGAGVRSNINHICFRKHFAYAVRRRILSTLGSTSPFVESVDVRLKNLGQKFDLSWLTEVFFVVAGFVAYELTSRGVWWMLV